MGKGRKKLPSKLKALRGTDRKDRQNPREPQPLPVVANADCPYPLEGRALAVWTELTEELTQIKVLTQADLQALKLLSESISEYDSLILRLWKTYPNGDRVYEPTINIYEIYEKGNKKKLSKPTLLKVITKPEVAMLAECRKFVKSLLAEFGLTPSSRSKVWAIGTPPPGKEKTKLQIMREKRAARKRAKDTA